VRRLRIVAVGLALLAGGCGGAAPGPAVEAVPGQPGARPGRPWNVLLITIDTLRADHLGAWGYSRPTSPEIDALAAEGALFERAYTYWPKTRASFVMMLTGLTPSRNGFSKTHPRLLDFNPTIAQWLGEAGYDTGAAVDNPNVASELGYARGFAEYVETWEDPALETEMDRTRAITEYGRRFLAASRERPFFLWLHYVNPHTPYEPPPPLDTAFVEGSAGPPLGLVEGFHGGLPRSLAIPGRRDLAWYVAQYDGEVRAADEAVGEVLRALRGSPAAEETLVILTSDHGESLGDHDYYFDHGADLHGASLHVPLVIRAPGAPPGLRRSELASTLDLFPTILDAVKLSYPPDLVGRSLMGAVRGGSLEGDERLFAQNDHHHRATWDGRFKLVAEPVGSRDRLELFDLGEDPGETRNVRQQEPAAFREQRRALDLHFERADREWGATRRRVEGAPEGESGLSAEACERLRALGYVDSCS